MSLTREDPRLAEAKALPMRDVVDRLGIAGLRPAGQEIVGPCPNCGGTDRFGVNLRSHMFLCRRCGIKGGDTVALVMAVQGLDFLPALSWLCGERQNIDPAELERRRDRAKQAEREREAEAARFRDWARRDARAIWSRATPQIRAHPVLVGYLEMRGLGHFPQGLPDSIRFLPDHPYVRKIGTELVTLHRGPCMIARIDGPGEDCVAVHQTWLNSHGGGKAAIIHEGQDYPAKMVRGAKRGGVIRLSPPDHRGAVLVMGEGIETTLTAMQARAVPGAIYWAGVDLGNISGRMARVEGVKWSGLPDMADRDAFVPPAWVRRLILIQDGDSHPKMTRAKLESGARRAMALRPGLKAQIVHPGAGVDLNDLVKPKPEGDA
jgi:hypothetical protein